MTSAEILAELQTVISDILDIPGLKLTSDTTAMDVEGWDSLSHINIISAVEERYGIRFALGELQDLKDVGDMADLVQKKLNR